MVSPRPAPPFSTQIDLGHGLTLSVTLSASRDLFLIRRSDGEEGEVPVDTLVQMLATVAAKRPCLICNQDALFLSFQYPSNPVICCRGCTASFVVEDDDLCLTA